MAIGPFNALSLAERQSRQPGSKMIRMLVAAAALTLFAVPAMAQNAETAAPAVLSGADAVTPVVLPLGVTSQLRLETNPSTGYGWQVVETQNLRVDEPFEVARDPATPRDRVGAPETAVIRITPRSKGPASLTLVYKQAWRDTAPDDRTLRFVFLAE